MYRAVIELIDNRKKRNILAKKAYEYSKQYREDVVSKKVYEIYEDVLREWKK